MERPLFMKFTSSWVKLFWNISMKLFGILDSQVTIDLVKYNVSLLFTSIVHYLCDILINGLTAQPISSGNSISIIIK